MKKLTVTATLVAAGDDARAMLDAMRENDPLIAGIDGTPNAHLVAFDLTTAGLTSQHKGGTRYRLAVAGVEASLPSLRTKPVHITANYDGHVDRGKKPKAIGAMLAGAAIQNADGTVTVRAFAALWGEDFPDEIATIRANRSTLGASYEIMYATTAAKVVESGVVEISNWVFSGAAILKKASAAHPESQLLVADKGGHSMLKFPGIPEELQASVDGIVSKAIADATKSLESGQKMADLEAKVAKLTTDLAAAAESAKKALETALAEAKTAKDTFEAQVADLTAKVAAGVTEANDLKTKVAAAEAKQAEAEGKLAESAAKLAEIETAKAAAELETKVTTELTKLAAAHSFDVKDEKLMASKRPIVTKMLKGEAISVEEATTLVAGGKPVKTNIVPLRAGAGDGTATDVEKIKDMFPNLRRLTAGEKK